MHRNNTILVTVPMKLHIKDVHNLYTIYLDILVFEVYYLKMDKIAFKNMPKLVIHALLPSG